MAHHNGPGLAARGKAARPEEPPLLGGLGRGWVDWKNPTIEQERTLLENLISDSHGDH